LKLKQGEKATYLLLKQNKEKGIAVLYERYGSKLYGYAVSTWKVDEDEAWDLVYKTLYKILDNIGKYEFESESKFGAIVFKIFINYLRKQYRSKQKMKEHLEFTTFNESLFDVKLESRTGPEQKIKARIAEESIRLETEEEVEEEITMVLLKKELEQLEDWQRMLLLLKGQNMPYSEIAKFIDKPASQLKVYYQRLKNRVMNNINAQLTTTPATKSA
jgi:RNA polymerase sigma factor (sigma-70 family)